MNRQTFSQTDSTVPYNLSSGPWEDDRTLRVSYLPSRRILRRGTGEWGVTEPRPSLRPRHYSTLYLIYGVGTALGVTEERSGTVGVARGGSDEGVVAEPWTTRTVTCEDGVRKFRSECRVQDLLGTD